MVLNAERNCVNQEWIQKIQREGAESPTPSPPNENFTFQDIQHTALWVFVMESRVTLTFRKIEYQRTFYKTISTTVRMGGSVQKCLKKGGRGPLGPSPKSTYVNTKTESQKIKTLIYLPLHTFDQQIIITKRGIF